MSSSTPKFLYTIPLYPLHIFIICMFSIKHYKTETLKFVDTIYSSNLFLIFRTKKIARPLKQRETANKVKPTAVRADKCNSVSDSAYCVASKLAIVCAGEKREALKEALFPITIVTAMVSPKALPNPGQQLPLSPRDFLLKWQSLTFPNGLFQGLVPLLYCCEGWR